MHLKDAASVEYPVAMQQVYGVTEACIKFLSAAGILIRWGVENRQNRCQVWPFAAKKIIIGGIICGAVQENDVGS